MQFVATPGLDGVVTFLMPASFQGSTLEIAPMLVLKACGECRLSGREATAGVFGSTFRFPPFCDFAAG